jgi:hypothetical protein
VPIEERVPLVYSPVFCECQPFFSWPAETLTVGKLLYMNDCVCDVPWTCSGAYNMSSGLACAAGATTMPRTNVAITTPTRERIRRLLRFGVNHGVIAAARVASGPHPRGRE